MKCIGFVESLKSLEIKGFRLFAAIKGIASSILTPCPAFGRSDRPSAFRNPCWVSNLVPSSSTAQGMDAVPIAIVPSCVAFGTPFSCAHRAAAARRALSCFCSAVSDAERARPPARRFGTDFVSMRASICCTHMRASVKCTHYGKAHHRQTRRRPSLLDRR